MLKLEDKSLQGFPNESLLVIVKMVLVPATYEALVLGTVIPLKIVFVLEIVVLDNIVHGTALTTALVEARSTVKVRLPLIDGTIDTL
jgi:hypothetical protein